MKNKNPAHIFVSGIEKEKKLSGRKKTKLPERMKQYYELFKKLFDNIPIGLCIADENGKIIAFNSAVLKPGGYRCNDIKLMTSPDEFFFEPIQMEEIKSIVRQKGELHRYEVKLKKKDGGYYIALLTLIPVQSDKKKQWYVVIEDVTERKKAEEELLKTKKLESLGILAGGIAHDFNNMLTAVLGNIQLAMSHIKNQSEPVYEKLAEAEKAAILAKSLTMKLLTFSKGGEPVKKLVSVEQLIEDSIFLSTSGSNTVCETNLSPDLLPVMADAQQITQVLQNIIINAKQAMPEGGKIMVKASNVDLTSRDNLPLEKGKYVKIEIRDEGEGIPEENLSKIFDPYFSTRKDGSGLGLATAYSIMKKHGGHITVMSKVGIGSTFTIYIPAAPVSKTLASKNDERKTNGNHQRIKILVMDDQKYVRNTIKTMLSLHNYEVVTAENGYQVIELYRKALMNEKPFDVVLLDLTVPGGYGGKETLRELLKIDPAVRAVALSGYSNDPAMAVYRIYGFKASISKPFDIDELLKTIETVMDNTTVHEEQKN